MTEQIANDNPASSPIRILLVEDNPADRRFTQEVLRESGLAHEVACAASLEEARRLLAEAQFDLLLVDLGLPDSQGLDTFALLHDLNRNLPIVVLTGLVDEAVAMKAMRRGAQDYLEKGAFDSRILSRAIRYAIERVRLLNEIQTLRGILPICAYCKKIRDDQGYWQQLESYIHHHTGVDFSHGMCPGCAEKAFAELEEFKKRG